jgi:predicted nucleic acid-binding Zn ribbon protein
MSASSPPEKTCNICGKRPAAIPEDKPEICQPCSEKSEDLFDNEMRRIELIRTIRGQDVELYDIKHPDASTDKQHCGQAILIRAGRGFEVKICLRSNTLDWMKPLSDDKSGFASHDTRLDALIGNVSLLIESWGGGPHYMDIFDVTRVVSIEGEI